MFNELIEQMQVSKDLPKQLKIEIFIFQLFINFCVEFKAKVCQHGKCCERTLNRKKFVDHEIPKIITKLCN